MSPPGRSGWGRRPWMFGAAGLAALGAGVGWRAWREGGGSSADEATADAFWALSLPTPSGASMPFAPLRGRPLVVNFWATWCPPCVKEMPELDRFARQFGGRGWQVLGLAIDQAPAVQKFLQQTPVSFPVVLADTGLGLEWVRRMGNPGGGLPFTVVFGPDGQVSRRKLGPTTYDELASWVI
ncbi:MAG: TlpA family protein disulfide reductase [Pseudomonadota bacterium]